MPSESIFFLGATGYLGGQLLVSLSRELPQYRIVALVRAVTPKKVAQINALHPNVTIVEGTLDDDPIIQEHASKADIVINTASSDHFPSVKSTLAGLEAGSSNKPGCPPLYIHVSGLGIISDNARGEFVESTKEWSDIDLRLEDCPGTNTHLISDKAIVAAGTRKENPVRTMIVFPCWIYGAVTRGIQRTTLPLRIFMDLLQKAGYSGTWGAGRNVMNNIHVLDVASAIITVLKAALEEKADEGAEGLYFAASMQPRISLQEWSARLGDILCSKGLIKVGGSRPLPDEVLEPLGEDGWSLLGGNHIARPERLARLGWEPKETLKTSLLDALSAEVDDVLENRVHGRISFV